MQLVLSAGSLLLLFLTAASSANAQVLAHYDFTQNSGDTIPDRSGNSLNLAISADATWTDNGLRLHGTPNIRSIQPATQLAEHITAQKTFTIESWVTPANTTQNGPARILSLSGDTSNRNLTLGQDGTNLDLRLRSTHTSPNGLPSTASAGLDTARQHLLATRDTDGILTLYRNGQRIKTGHATGDLNWNPSYHLHLGNEQTGDRPWHGVIHAATIHGRALSPTEVAKRYEGGRNYLDKSSNSKPTETKTPSDAPKTIGILSPTDHDRFFHTKLAPLLARHCLECHDPATRKGKVDLSRKSDAFAEVTDGPLLVPGDPDASVLWHVTEFDDMPEDRPPLTPDEKHLLKTWIANGAHWPDPPADFIDPAIYMIERSVDPDFVQRLTIPQYIQTILDATGVDLQGEAEAVLPPDLRADGFRNTAYNLTVDLKHIQAYATLAERVVARIDWPAFILQHTPCADRTDDCFRRSIHSLGNWFLRGPLDDREADMYLSITDAVLTQGGDYAEAIRFVTQAMLQSPRFLYRIENQNRPLSQFELASRLSYILWGAPPDAKLLADARDGRLSDTQHDHIKRMLADPRARQQSLHFVTDWLNLDRLENLQRDKHHFPDWNPQLGRDMREETLAFFTDIVWTQNRPLADLFNAQSTHARAKLADYYGLPPNPTAQNSENKLAAYDLSQTPGRGGLLTQGSVLTIGGGEASMVARGLFVMNDLLRGVVRDPPPCVDTTPVPSAPGLTQRAIAEKRVADRSCGGCHSKFEPLAYGLERYDGTGRFLQNDHFGNTLREDGTVVVPGLRNAIPYRKADQLMDILANSERVKETLTWKLTQFALGRPLMATDAQHVATIHAEGQKNGGAYPAVLTAILNSDLVQK